MKFWRCPRCRRERVYDKELVMKVCSVCDFEMEVVDYGEK